MLVLTRHVHQSIVIGHDVVVTVLEVRGDQVRLGITAPKDVQVHREEVFAALTAANRQAATSSVELQVLSELADAPRQATSGSDNQAPSPPASGPSPAPGQTPPRGPQARSQFGGVPGSFPGQRRVPPPPPPSRRAADGSTSASHTRHEDGTAVPGD